MKNKPEEPLVRVLKSLYGAELEANSVEELTQLYDILNFLGVEDYKQNIVNEVCSKSHLQDSLEMLEFGYKYNIMVK